MCDYLVLTQSVSLLIIALTLCVVAKRLLSVWSIVNNEIRALEAERNHKSEGAERPFS